MTAMIRSEHVIEITYLVATALFILSLKWMSSPTTARRGVRAGELGMLLAIAGTLLHHGIVEYRWIAIALVLGTIIGVPLGMVQMTAVPQRTALSHAFGALCVTLVGTAEFYLQAPDVPRFMMAVLALEVILGSLTFTGSLMAAGKLQEVLPQRPITYKGQNSSTSALLALAVGIAAYLVFDPGQTWLFPLIVVIPLLFGVLMIIPIGGADMPTVISLLNSYAGLSAAAMGFVLDSKLLIIAGALDGASGFILSVNMSKAMNRSFTNVLFGAFGQEQATAAGGAGSAAGQERDGRGGGGDPRRGQQGGHRARLRHGGGAGPAQGARALRRADQARRGRQVRHPSGRRTDARPHERPAGRGRHPLRQAARHGRDQRRLPADRRRAGHRRQRRDQPRGAQRRRRARSTACRSWTWTRRAP